MQRFTPPQRLFAYTVAGLAGFVDVTGYLQLNGYFVSFMTGNTTLLARDLAEGASRVAVPALLICAALARMAEMREISLGLLVIAMGALNTVLSANRESPVGLTYMTGALVRTGQLLADRLSGDRTADPLPFALLWVSLLTGALCGGVLAMQWGAASLWVAGGLALTLCLAATRIAPARA